MTGIAASSLTPFALRRIGDRATLLTGGVATAIGFAGLAVAHDDLTVFLVLTAFNGIGLGVFESATRALSVEAVPQEDTAIAAGINELVLSLGAAVGAAALSAALAAHSDSAGHVAAGGYTTGWWMCCGGRRTRRNRRPVSAEADSSRGHRGARLHTPAGLLALTSTQGATREHHPSARNRSARLCSAPHRPA